MNKLSTIAVKASAAAMSLGVMASTVLAETLDYSYEFDTYSDPVGGIFAGGFFLVYCCMCLLGAVMLGLWVWMLIDVMKRTETELPDKTTWILIIVLLGGIGALVYYFSKKRALDAKK